MTGRTAKFLHFVLLAVLLPGILLAESASEPELLAPGVVYREFRREEGPWAIQVLEVSRNVANLSVEVALGSRKVIGLEPLPNLVRRVAPSTHPILAAINGDYFLGGPYRGQPSGFCVSDGELLREPVEHRSALILLEDGAPEIGRFQFHAEVKRFDDETFPLSGINRSCPENGIVLLTSRFHISTRAEPDAVQLLLGELPESPFGVVQSFRSTVLAKLVGAAELVLNRGKAALVGRGAGAEFLRTVELGGALECAWRIEPDKPGIRHAIGGGPRILRDGKLSIEAEPERIGQAFVETRHPRTAFGYNAEKTFWVTVDGRQPGYSVGMSLPELANLMLELGAMDALNLDGGGSTTMWIQGRVRNRPSDGKPRPLGNALILFQNLPRNP